MLAVAFSEDIHGEKCVLDTHEEYASIQGIVAFYVYPNCLSNLVAWVPSFVLLRKLHLLQN